MGRWGIKRLSIFAQVARRCQVSQLYRLNLFRNLGSVSGAWTRPWMAQYFPVLPKDPGLTCRNCFQSRGSASDHFGRGQSTNRLAIPTTYSPVSSRSAKRFQEDDEGETLNDPAQPTAPTNGDGQDQRAKNIVVCARDVQILADPFLPQIFLPLSY